MKKIQVYITKEMEEDIERCNEEHCDKCSCRLGEDDCILGYPMEKGTIADEIRNMSINTLALYLHSWQAENMSVKQIKEMLNQTSVVSVKKGGNIDES